MINSYYAIEKHNDMQRMASVGRQSVPDYDADHMEILREAQARRAAMLRRICESAWMKLRKALSHQTASDSFAGKGVVG